MTTPELIEFVKKDLARGTTRIDITNKLKLQGWDDLDVIEVFNIVLKDNPIPLESFRANELPKMSSPDNFAATTITKDKIQPLQTTEFRMPSGLNTSYQVPTDDTKPSHATRNIIIMLIIIIILGGGYFAYFSGYYKTVVDKFSKNSNPIEVSTANDLIAPSEIENTNKVEETQDLGYVTESTSPSDPIVSSTEEVTPTTPENIPSQADNTSEVKVENKADTDKMGVVSSMRSLAESYFVNNKNLYTGFCRSKTDGAYTLAVTLPKASVYKCSDKETEWSAYVQLSDKAYSCSDSTGFFDSVKVLPKGTACRN